MRLKVGLEVHAQLASARKLFSNSRTSFHATPNSQVSYFDAAIPGTQPIFNWECMYLALKAATALGATVNSTCAFDRKHYMYPDQPAGYQITQFYRPYANGGYLDLFPRDFHQSSQEALRVRIRQLQMEQDTGKSTYVDGVALIDLNRANTPLIELITEPDMTTPEQAGVFVRKLQTLLRHLGVCTGDMETGALRVDVNVSAHAPGFDGPRCEIKNLFSTTAVVAAIKAEFRRQVADIEKGKTIISETRGWDGKKTWALRAKEGVVDYRYMPDPEIPEIHVPDQIVSRIRDSLPVLPDDILEELIGDAYKLKFVDARTLMDHGMEYVNFFRNIHARYLADGGQSPESIINWIVHKWLGKTKVLPSEDLFLELFKLIDEGTITTASARLLVNHLASLAGTDALSSVKSLKSLVDEYDLTEDSEADTLEQICSSIIAENPDVVERIKKGKKSSISYLLGQVMKLSQGTYNPKAVKETLEKIIQS